MTLPESLSNGTPSQEGLLASPPTPTARAEAVITEEVSESIALAGTFMPDYYTNERTSLHIDDDNLITQAPRTAK
jgi:hypothetical protein